MVNLDWKAVLAVGGVALVLIYLAQRQARQAAQAVGDAINPVSADNVFYQGASGVVGAVTGDKSATVGTWLYDVLHPGQ